MGVRQGKKDPKHVVVAVAATPVDRTALLAEIEAAKSVRELADILKKMALLLPMRS